MKYFITFTSVLVNYIFTKMKKYQMEHLFMDDRKKISFEERASIIFPHLNFIKDYVDLYSGNLEPFIGWSTRNGIQKSIEKIENFLSCYGKEMSEQRMFEIRLSLLFSTGNDALVAAIPDLKETEPGLLCEFTNDLVALFKYQDQIINFI